MSVPAGDTSTEGRFTMTFDSMGRKAGDSFLPSSGATGASAEGVGVGVGAGSCAEALPRVAAASRAAARAIVDLLIAPPLPRTPTRAEANGPAGPRGRNSRDLQFAPPASRTSRTLRARTSGV